MEEADARFDESMAVITKAFTSDTPWSHQGQYWQYDNIVVEPPTAQRPHPPFWMGAGSERSVRQVAERGYNMLLGQHDLAEEVVRHVALFRRRSRRAAAVMTRCRSASPARCISPTPGGTGGGLYAALPGPPADQQPVAPPAATTASALPSRTRQRVRHHCDETAVFGTTDQICRKLEALRDGGVEYVIVNFGGSRENIRRFARDVMPAFADAPRDKQARDGQAMAVAAK